MTDEEIEAIRAEVQATYREHGDARSVAARDRIVALLSKIDALRDAVARREDERARHAAERHAAETDRDLLLSHVLKVCADSGLRPDDGVTPQMLLRTLGDSERGAWANAESYQAEVVRLRPHVCCEPPDDASVEIEIDGHHRTRHALDCPLFQALRRRDERIHELGVEIVRLDGQERDNTRTIELLAAENGALMDYHRAWIADGDVVDLAPATRRVLAAVEYAESHVELDDMRCEVRYDEEIGERICERAERANTAYRALREDTDD